MTSAQVLLVTVWVLTTAMNYWALNLDGMGREMKPKIARAALLLIAAIPLTTVAVIGYGIRAWFRRHWRIVKIERSLRDR